MRVGAPVKPTSRTKVSVKKFTPCGRIHAISGSIKNWELYTLLPRTPLMQPTCGLRGHQDRRPQLNPSVEAVEIAAMKRRILIADDPFPSMRLAKSGEDKRTSQAQRCAVEIATRGTNSPKLKCFVSGETSGRFRDHSRSCGYSDQFAVVAQTVENLTTIVRPVPRPHLMPHATRQLFSSSRPIASNDMKGGTSIPLSALRDLRRPSPALFGRFRFRLRPIAQHRIGEVFDRLWQLWDFGLICHAISAL